MIVALAGGVGGARLAEGLARLLGSAMTTIVNTGDDFVHLGLHISPDVDTVVYTLAGMSNAHTGWGVAGESWCFLDQLSRLGGPTWFRLGDRDLATHVLRTARLQAGQSLTAVTADHCRHLGIAARVLPMSDDVVRTIVHSADGDIAFQEYFVKRKCEVAVTGFTFAGSELARPSAEVEAALRSLDLEAVILCPSNPFVSIDPILSLPGMRQLITKARVPVIAVSPIIGGAAVKGPAAKMMVELGLPSSAATVAAHYRGLVTGFVMDTADAALTPLISQDMAVRVTDILMRDSADRLRLAQECLMFMRSLTGPPAQR
jgi:LPPG:FO 2-phospho-L-lactate transferase